MKDQVDLSQVSPEQLPFNSVGSYFYHDLQLGYTFDFKVKTKLYGGIRNVFDKKPPFLPTGMYTQITGTETAPGFLRRDRPAVVCGHRGAALIG